MILSLLSEPILLFVWLLAIVFALTGHEFAHALVARLLGDRTAEREGRLTLNPLSHLDPIGSLMLVLFGFGWAKPVPYNPYNLRDPRWGSVLVGLAGPGANLAMALVASGVLRGLLASGAGASSALVVFLFFFLFINIALMVFNLIPVHPLDGAKLALAIFDTPATSGIRQWILTRGPQVLLILVFLSILGFNVFGFISDISFAICDGLLSSSCEAVLRGR